MLCCFVVCCESRSGCLVLGGRLSLLRPASRFRVRGASLRMPYVAARLLLLLVVGALGGVVLVGWPRQRVVTSTTRLRRQRVPARRDAGGRPDRARLRSHREGCRRSLRVGRGSVSAPQRTRSCCL